MMRNICIVMCQPFAVCQLYIIVYFWISFGPQIKYCVYVFACELLQKGIWWIPQHKQWWLTKNGVWEKTDRRAKVNGAQTKQEVASVSAFPPNIWAGRCQVTRAWRIEERERWEKEEKERREEHLVTPVSIIIWSQKKPCLCSEMTSKRTIPLQWRTATRESDSTSVYSVFIVIVYEDEP